ncbi:gas vesicle protein GvpP [Rossellomorea aquimaris]|uniref:GvpT/GvpP family gas vesicle accessory protein n=1 Tax=Rossellomorea aquimaris TaxID=189382 RepID=UPI001CD2A902|nr:GvpT/GvpP family gas vesicle accessory protein [Rossellomorea aquimaris]MCA1054992.1 gas vesicle protein GvpP [Rossellomorea aquimaris]
MAETKKQEKTNREDQQTQAAATDDNKSGVNVNYAIIGGVVGAGVGLLTHPGTSKKIAGSLGKSEVVRMAGTELRRTAQEFITEQALITLRQTATGYMSKYENGRLPFTRKKEDPQGESGEESVAQHDEIEEIKEENKNLNERLERIEEMLSSLVESKK